MMFRSKPEGGHSEGGVLPQWLKDKIAAQPEKSDSTKQPPKTLGDFETGGQQEKTGGESAETLKDFEIGGEPSVKDEDGEADEESAVEAVADKAGESAPAGEAGAASESSENPEDPEIEEDVEVPEETEKPAAVKEAEDFLRANMAAIVEGVLNTTDDINQKENYIEGSNLDIRNQLGEKMKAIGDAGAEAELKSRMKADMAEYLRAHEKELAESAIKNAPSLASLFEVVKRYKEIKDGEKTFSREDLLAARENILSLEGRLDVYLNLGGENNGVDAGDISSMKGLIRALTEGLPESMDIKNEVAKRLQSKMSEVESYAMKAEPAGKETAPEEAEAPAKAGFFSKIKAGFSRLWGRK